MKKTWPMLSSIIEFVFKENETRGLHTKPYILSYSVVSSSDDTVFMSL